MAHTETYRTTLNDGSVVTSNHRWRVVWMEPLPDYELKVKFVDEIAGLVQLRDLIFSDKAGGFAVLRDPAIFRQAQLRNGAIEWPDGLRLASDVMHEAIVAKGIWTLS